MKKIIVAAVIALTAVGLTGCSFGDKVENIDSSSQSQDVPPVTTDEWNQAVTLEEFADYFPELDTTDLVAIPTLVAQQNTRLWALGTSDKDHSYEKAVGWAENYVELVAEEGNDTVSGVYIGEDRNVDIAIRQVGDDVDTAGFIMYITSSK